MERRRFLKYGAGAAASLSVAGCIDSLPGSTGEEDGEDEEVITIGSDIPYRPFEYYDEDDELVGFDVEIAGAVFGEELELEYEFQETAWDGIIQSLNNGNFRVIMSAMTITDERAERVDFSDPYFTAYQTVIVLKDGDVSDLEDLQGESVGVQKGTTGDDAAQELKEDFDGDLTVQQYDQIQGAFDALLNNQVVAVVNDNTVNAEFVEENEDTVAFLEGEGEAEAQGKEAPPYLTLTVEEYGIALRQDDDEFREEINDALAAIRDSGRYDEIYSTYFAG